MRSLGSIFMLGALILCAAGCQDPTDDDDDSASPGSSIPVTAVTFNTGTSEAMGHDGDPDDGYSSDHAAFSDEYYGDGLAWLPAVAATTTFLAEVAPDVIAFQEIFHPGECAEIPSEAQADFICETWQDGDPTVAQAVLGAGYQVMCIPDHPDKCAAVRLSFGSFRDCEADLCLDGLFGTRIEDCGSAARVGRGLVDLVDGGELSVVAVHGTSGMGEEDMECRARQVEQVFVDLGDGEPGANGEHNLILGDFNTDPARMAGYDPSADRWNDFVTGDPFAFLTAVGEDAPPTYATVLNIDHVIGDSAVGSCWHAGVTEGHPEVIDAIYFDHLPAVCELEIPS
jgi:hypothetical protein